VDCRKRHPWGSSDVHYQRRLESDLITYFCKADKSPGTRGVIEWPGLRFAWTQLPARSAAKFYQNDYVLEEKKGHIALRLYADYLSFFSTLVSFLKSSSNVSCSSLSEAWISVSPRPIARLASVR